MDVSDNFEYTYTPSYETGHGLADIVITTQSKYAVILELKHAQSKDDLVKAGHDIKDSADTKKDYFTATETDYLADGDVVRVYEFDNSKDADDAVSKISTDGLSINGTAIYTTKPHYYRKGNTVVIYEGSNDAYINEFNNLYGNPIV